MEPAVLTWIRSSSCRCKRTTIDSLLKSGLIAYRYVCSCPDDASVKSKMVYASSAGAIKQALNTGKIMALQVCDEASMNHRDLIDKLSDKFSDKIRS